jgi:hypothetical protein
MFRLGDTGLKVKRIKTPAEAGVFFGHHTRTFYFAQAAPHGLCGGHSTYYLTVRISLLLAPTSATALD